MTNWGPLPALLALAVPMLGGTLLWQWNRQYPRPEKIILMLAAGAGTIVVLGAWVAL